MFRKKCFLAAVLAIACLFTSCDPENSGVEIIQTDSSSFTTLINDVRIKVSPTEVKLGESISIDITHEKGDSVYVKILSESLAYEKSVTTPYHTKMRMDSVGVHDLSFTTSQSFVGIGVGTNITVKE